MKKVIVFLCGLILVSSFCSAAMSATEIRTMAFDQIAYAPRMGEIPSKAFFKGDSVRLETEMQQQKTIVIIKATGEVYTYTPANNTAMKMNMGSLQNEQALATKNTALDVVKGLYSTKIGEEAVDGVLCGVYSYEPPDAKAKMKIWVSKQTGFPVRMESESPENSMRIVMDNFRYNIPLADSLFEIPAGVKIIDMKQMMQGLGKGIMKDTGKGLLKGLFK